MMNSSDNSQALLDDNGFAVSMTSGKSMRPLIWGGQHCVAVVPLDGEPAVGDLLFFRLRVNGAEKNIVHRLVRIEERGGERIYITRGDNCLGTETVRRTDIMGRVAEVHRLSGFRPWHAIPRRQFTMTDRAYRRYSRLWGTIWPLRRIYYKLRGHAHGLTARLRRKK